MTNNYAALTLGRYMEINAVLESAADDLDKQVQIIAILADKTQDEVLLLPLSDYTAMAKETAFLREPCKPTEIAPGWKYGNLVPVEDFTKINTAQYIDFQTFSKGFPATLPQLLSVFLVPEGHAYNEGYDIRKVQDEVLGIPFPDAVGLAAFFFARFSDLITDSLTSWGRDLARTKDAQAKAAIREKIAGLEALLRSAGDGLQM